MIKTLAELKAYFETGDKPTQSEFENLIDSTYRGYKVYTALLTQTGTDAPVATVLQNTLGVVPAWSYEGIGEYNFTSSGLFVKNKTVVFIQRADDTSTVCDIFYGITNGDFIYVSTGLINTSGASASLTATNELLNNTSIEIRVYN